MHLHFYIKSYILGVGDWKNDIIRSYFRIMSTDACCLRLSKRLLLFRFGVSFSCRTPEASHAHYFLPKVYLFFIIYTNIYDIFEYYFPDVLCYVDGIKMQRRISQIVKKEGTLLFA